MVTIMEPVTENRFAKFMHWDFAVIVLGAFLFGAAMANGFATHDAVKGSEQYYLTKVVAPLKHKAAVERAKAVTATKDKEAICNVAVANGDIQTLTDAKRCMPELGKP